MGIVGTLHIGALPSPVLGFPYAQTWVPRAWRRRIFKTLVLDAVVSLDLDLGSPFPVPRRPSPLWSVRGCSEGILLAPSVECLTYRWCLTCLAAVCVGGVGWRGLCLNLSAWWTRPQHFFFFFLRGRYLQLVICSVGHWKISKQDHPGGLGQLFGSQGATGALAC